MAKTSPEAHLQSIRLSSPFSIFLNSVSCRDPCNLFKITLYKSTLKQNHFFVPHVQFLHLLKPNKSSLKCDVKSKMENKYGEGEMWGSGCTYVLQY